MRLPTELHRASTVRSTFVRNSALGFESANSIGLMSVTLDDRVIFEDQVMSAPQGMPCGADTSSAKLGIFTSAQMGSIQPVPTTVVRWKRSSMPCDCGCSILVMSCLISFSRRHIFERVLHRPPNSRPWHVGHMRCFEVMAAYAGLIKRGCWFLFAPRPIPKWPPPSSKPTQACCAQTFDILIDKLKDTCHFFAPEECRYFLKAAGFAS